jgi:hypothetical protein
LSGFVSMGPEPRLPMPYGFCAMTLSYFVSQMLRRIEDEHPIREVTIYKGQAVGATTGVLENCIDYAIAHRSQEMFAGDDGDAESGARWSTTPSDPIQDINAVWEMISSPGYAAAQRREYEYEMKRLARLWERAGYKVPPPYGSGA